MAEQQLLDTAILPGRRRAPLGADDLGVIRIDKALPATVGDLKNAVADTMRDLLPLVVVPTLIYAIAVPDTGNTADRTADQVVLIQYGTTVQLDITLRCRADARSRRIGNQPRAAKAGSP